MDLNTMLKAQWDRATAIGCTALGAILLLVGWIGVSGTPFLAEQAPYILSGGVGGVFMLGVGATLWISADLRDEWRKLDRIEAALLDGTLRFAENDEAAGALPGQRASAEPVREEVPRLAVSTATRRAPVVAEEPEVLASSRAKAARSAGTRSSTAVAPPKRRSTGVGHA